MYRSCMSVGMTAMQLPPGKSLAIVQLLWRLYYLGFAEAMTSAFPTDHKNMETVELISPLLHKGW